MELLELFKDNQPDRLLAEYMHTNGGCSNSEASGDVSSVEYIPGSLRKCFIKATEAAIPNKASCKTQFRPQASKI